MSCLLLWAGNLNFLLRIVIWIFLSRITVSDKKLPLEIIAVSLRLLANSNKNWEYTIGTFWRSGNFWMKIWSHRITSKLEKFCPKLGQNFSNFFVHILGNATTSYFHSVISWPLKDTKQWHFSNEKKNTTMKYNSKWTLFSRWWMHIRLEVTSRNDGNNAKSLIPARIRIPS